jgi:sugar lactone lactonase YvrE
VENLLTDHDDPEKRIAHLERSSAASRRFVASAAPPSTKQMMKYSYLLIFGVMASLGAVNMALLLIGSIVGSSAVWQVGGAVVFFTFLLGAMPAYGAFQRRMNRAKQVLIDVGSDDLTVNTKPGDVFSFGGARLGPWTLAGYGGTAKGTALHLRSGAHSFVLGGQDHRAATGTPLQAPAVDSVDAWLWAPEFDEFLAAVGGPAGLDVRVPAPGQPIRCRLTPNPARMYSSSFFGMFKNTATALRLNANPPRSSLAIDVGDDEISVVDLKSNARIASAPSAQVTATPAASTRSIPRMGAMTTPVLVVGVPNSEPLTVGCPDFAGPPQSTRSGKTKLSYRFAWRGEVPAEQEPAYVVSDPDWLTLVEKFGLAPRLEDKARTAPDAAGTTPGAAPLARPKRKLWIYGVIIAAVMFVAVPTMMVVAGNIASNHQNKDNQLKADRLRPFTLPFTDLRVPHGVAVDAAGNVYITDGRTNRVLKLAAGSNTPTVLPFTGLDLSDGVINTSTGSVAVDAAGNVYVADTGNSRVLELAAGSSAQTVLPFRGPGKVEGVAVDSAGTVYVVGYSDGRVLKLAAGSHTQTVLPKTGRGSPSGDVAVDRDGNVYIHASRRGGGYLLKLAPESDTWTTLPSSPGSEQFVAADPAGNLYVISGDAVMRLAPGSDSWTEVPGARGFVDPQGLAVDSRGNVYVTDHLGARQPVTAFGIWPMGPDDAQGFVLKLPTS